MSQNDFLCFFLIVLRIIIVLIILRLIVVILFNIVMLTIFCVEINHNRALFWGLMHVRKVQSAQADQGRLFPAKLDSRTSLYAHALIAVISKRGSIQSNLCVLLSEPDDSAGPTGEGAM